MQGVQEAVEPPNTRHQTASSPVKLSYRSSTITMLMLEDLVLMSSGAAYSGEPGYSFAR